ncbi:hypothetical protein D3C71_1035360 [compost metagenome]
MAFGHVELAAREEFLVRIGTLIHGVPCHRRDGAALLGVHGRDPHVFMADLAEHGLLAAVGLGAERRALQDLAQVVGLIGRETVVQRRGGKDRRIRTAPADDHIGAGLQQLQVGLHARHRHDAVRGVQLRFNQIGIAVQARDGGAGAHLAAHELRVDFGIEVADLEGLQAMLLRQFLDDADIQVDPAVRAGVARGSDDHRHALRARGQQHLLQVVALPGFGAGGGVGAQGHGTDIVAARIGGDVIGLPTHAGLETLGTQGREAQVSIRTNNSQGAHLSDSGVVIQGHADRGLVVNANTVPDRRREENPDKSRH